MEERLTPSSYDTLSFSGGAQYGASIAPNQPTGAITVQLQDSSGKALTATSNVTVQLSSSSNTGKFLDLSGKQLTNNSIVIPTGSSYAFFEYEDSQTGQMTIKGLSNSPFAYGGMYENVADKLVFTTPPQTLTPGQVSQPITLQLQDANGNAVKAASDVTVTLYGPTTGKFLDTSGNALPTSNGFATLTIAAGSSSASFAFEDSQAESYAPSLTASITGGSSAYQSVHVSYSLGFTTPVQVIASNTLSGPITVQLQDANGNAVKAASAVTINLSSTYFTGKFFDTSGNALPASSTGYGSALTIAAGSSSASFKYEDSSLNATPTITASTGSFSSSFQQQIFIGQPLAITTPVQTIATGKASQPIAVQLESPAASNETLYLSSSSATGTFLDTSGNPLPTSNGQAMLTVVAGSSSASFEYEDTTTGLPTLSIETSDLTYTATQQVSVGVALKFTTSPQTIAGNQASQPITVQLQDGNGNAFTTSTGVTVSLTSSGGGQFLDTSGNPIYGSVSIAAGSSSASFVYQSTNQTGTQSVTATVLGLSSLSASQQETVTSPPFTSVAFLSPAQTIGAGQASQPITLQLQNNGSSYTTTSSVAIKLSSSSTTGKFLDTSGNALLNNTITVAAGSSSASFEYQDSTEWAAGLMATVSGSSIVGFQTENVGNISLAFSTPPQTLTAGTPSGTITVQLQDGKGNTIANQQSFPLTITLSNGNGSGQFLDTTGKPLASNQISIAAGSSSASFEYEDTVGGKPNLTASVYVGNQLSASQQETVNGPYKVQFVAYPSSAQSIGLNQASQPITVQLVDSSGAVVTPTSAVTINLSSSSSGGKFLDTSGNALANNTITVAAGSSSASFEYKDSQAGLPTLTASENGFSATQQESVGAKLVFTTSAQTLAAGQKSQTLTVQLQDGNGNAIAAPNDIALNLYGSLSANSAYSSVGVQFLDTSGNPLSTSAGSPTITIAKGSNLASFEFNSSWGGTLTVSADYGASYLGSPTAALSASQQETVQGLSALVFTTSPQTVTAGQTSGTITVQLQDNNGNPANAPNGGLTLNLSNGSAYYGLASSKFYDANGNLLPGNQYGIASLTIPAGSNSASFKFESTQAGPASITASVTNGFSQTQVETVQTAAPNSVAFLTPASSQAAGTPSGSLTVQLVDQYGNAIAAGSGGLTFNLSSTSGTGKFLSVSGDALSNSSITIPQGATSATFEYQDSQAGTPTLKAAASGVSGTQQATIASSASLIHVTNTNDSGAGSLRAAINAAIANGGGTIIFDAGVTGTIDLLSELPGLPFNTNIIGPGANVLTIERSSSATSTFGGFTVGFTSSQFAPPEPAVTISGLTLANFDGSAIQNDGDLTLRQVEVTKTQAVPISSNPYSYAEPQSGISNTGTLTVLDSTIDNNAYSGIYSNSSYNYVSGITTSTNLTVINSTITGNTGGGITALGISYIASSTISGNTDTNPPEFAYYSLNGFGGGITSVGSLTSSNNVSPVTLYDTIVAGNTGIANANNDVYGPFNSLGYNLIGQADGNSSIGFISTDIVGTTANPINPKLGGLTNNGGPTPTLALLTGSPAISAGSSANAPATDQRGDARPQGAIDIGAVEVTTTSGPVAPSITGSPTNQSALVGDNVSFTASASGSPSPTVKWQVSTDGGKTFTDITGATSTTLSLTSVTLNMNSNEYQAVFTNSAGSVTTSAATLTVSLVATVPSITGNPSNQTVTAGKSATFTASASGSPTPTVQWQVSTDGGKTFTNISGATSTTLTLNNVTTDLSGNEYQAIFSNSAGTTPTSAATLTVQFAPTVTTNPTGQTLNVGQNATFTAAANGNPTPTVQWQVSTDGGKTFTNISGATSTTLAVNNVTAAMNGNEYQAVFTNSVGSTPSAAATLSVQFAPTVTTNPANQSVTQTLDATFTAAVSAYPLATVKWQVSTDGGKTWTNITGATNATLTVSNVTQAMSGNEYQAIFTNALGSITTSAAILTVTAPVAPIITGNPVAKTVTAGQAVGFTASASGSPTPTVQWQVSTDAGKTFTNINGATNATLVLNNVTTSLNGNQYQAVFTNVAGSVTSAAVTLNVNAPPPPPPLPPAPPVPQAPPLLQFLNSIFGGGTVTVNPNGTETVTDTIFGFPLVVSNFDSSGHLLNVQFFGIDITFLFFLL